MITVNLWELLASASVLLGLAAAAVRAILTAYLAHLDDRFEHIESLRQSGVEHWEQRFIALTQINRELHDTIRLMRDERNVVTREELDHAIDRLTERMNRYSRIPSASL